MKSASWPRWASSAAVAAGSVALFAHARRFDFICDDAYITFRYARNLATLGAPVYNLGERVEGYTNFLWMLLAAPVLRTGLDVPAVVVVLGALSAVVLMVGVLLLWRGLRALPRWPSAIAIALVAMTAPVAVWTLGGLETCLYAGLLAVSCALGASAIGSGNTRAAAAAGASLALATLTRPEGAAAFAVVFGVLVLFRARRTGFRATAGALVFGYLAVALPHLIWRRTYYGDWLPNTFYVKTSGDAAVAHRAGIGYLRLWASDFGWSSWLMALALVAPSPRALPGEPEEEARSRRATLWLLRLNIGAVLASIVWIGGDFLGAFRFLVPALPLAVVLVVASAAQWAIALLAMPRVAAPTGARARWGVGVAVASLLAAYGARQHGLWVVFEEGSHIEDPPAALEAIRWTRIWARRWAALGRWIGEHAKPGDWMAEGAAGASPYYAGINNLDLYGLNDRYIARHGEHLGNKPGHQRWAPKEYVLSKQPVFSFFSVARITEHPDEYGRDGWFERRGYVSVQVRIDPRYGVPAPFYIVFEMRKDRAVALRADPSITIDPDER